MPRQSAPADGPSQTPRRYQQFLIALAVALVLATGLLLLSSPATAQQPTTHSTEGRAECLVCHSATSTTARPAPANHEGRPNPSCLLCHRPIAASPQPMPTPTPTPPAPPPAPGPGTIATPAATATPTPPTPEASPTATPVLPPAMPGRPSQAQSCLFCHGQPGLTLSLSSGENLSLFTDPQRFASSVHGDKLTCADCHRGYISYPHAPRQMPATHREYTLAQYELCKRCHFSNYARTLDSVHYLALTRGDPRAPICTDCHGAHDVTRPDQPRTRISATCSKCHGEVYSKYQASIHGAALIGEGNPDVPVCTTCHSSHSISNPLTGRFRLEIPDLCGRCHGDASLMKKYGISSKVTKTYLADFHGASIFLLRQEHPSIAPNQAVCTDCHGVHDIVKPDAPNSPLLKENLVQVCRKCHEGATTNFPTAWLSHYEPSLSKAPVVFTVRMFYMVLIPFIVGGLVLHILVDLWRVATNR